MKAVQFDDYGGVEVLEVREVTRPEPGPDASFTGRLRSFARKCAGFGVWGSVARPMWWIAEMKRPAEIPTLSET